MGLESKVGIVIKEKDYQKLLVKIKNFTEYPNVQKVLTVFPDVNKVITKDDNEYHILIFKKIKWYDKEIAIIIQFLQDIPRDYIVENDYESIQHNDYNIIEVEKSIKINEGE